MTDPKDRQTTVNDPETSGDSDKNLTQPDSRPVRYRLIGPDGKAYSYLYEKAGDAAAAAQDLWPGVEQRGENGRDGWDIEVVR